MANKPFDRVMLNPRERPLSSDINQYQSEADRTLRALLERIYSRRTSLSSDVATPAIDGVIGDGLKVRPVSPISMQVRVPAGYGSQYNASDLPSAIGGVQGVDDLSAWKPLALNADVTFTVPAAHPTLPRYDIIEVRANRAVADLSSRDVLNTSTGRFEPVDVYKTLSWAMEGSTGVVASPSNSTAAVSLKTGTPAAFPAVPSTTTGYVKVAELIVDSGVTTLDVNAIRDLRRMLFPASQWSIACQLTTALSGPLVCSLANLIAPPGVQVVGLSTALAYGACEIYIAMGALPASALPVVQADTYGVSPVNTPLTCVTSTSKVSLNAPLQTLLAGSQASPATTFAIGQELLKATLMSGAAGGPASTTYNLQVSGLVVP